MKSGPMKLNFLTPWKLMLTKFILLTKIHRAKGGSPQHGFHFREQDYGEVWGYMVYIHQSIIQYQQSMGQLYYISRVRVLEPHGSIMLNIHCVKQYSTPYGYVGVYLTSVYPGAVADGLRTYRIGQSLGDSDSSHTF